MCPAIDSGDRWEITLQDHIKTLLESNNDESRAAAADSLSLEIKRLSTTIPSEALSNLMHDLNRRLFELIHGNESADKLAAIYAISRLAEQSTDETIGNFPRYANYIRGIFPCKDIALASVGARAIAALVMNGGQLIGRELIDYEYERAMEWLEEKNEHGTMSAMSIFKAIAQVAPNSLVHIIRNVIQLSVSFLLASSKNQLLQKISLECTTALFEIYFASASSQSNDVSFMEELVRHSLEGSKLVTNSQDLISYILIVRIFASTGKKWITRDLLEHLCVWSLQLCSHKDSLVKMEALKTIPEIISIEPNYFAETYLTKWIESILIDLIRKRDRDLLVICFLMLRQSINVLQYLILPMLNLITDSINGLLNNARPKRHTEEFRQILGCIVELAKVLKAEAYDSMNTMLPSLLGYDLNEEIVDALRIVSDNVPTATLITEDQILRFISMALKGSDETRLIFACETVSKFYYSEPILEGVIGQDLIGLLDRTDVSTNIKKLSAQALAHIMKKPEHGDFLEPFGAVLNAALVLMGLVASFPDEQLKISILESLNHDSLDFYLSAPEPFHLLLMAMASGPLGSRLLAVSIVERISRNNTGLLYPHFRSILLQSFADLSCNSPEYISEEAAVLLSEIVKFPLILVKPVAEPILCALTPRLLDPNANTSTSVLITFERLVSVNPLAFSSHALSLVNSVSGILLDQNSSKRRRAALAFLCNLLRHVRSRIPFERLAELLLETAELLKVELMRPVRTEAIRLLGIIGALDPYKMRSREILHQQVTTLLPTIVDEGKETPVTGINTTTSDLLNDDEDNANLQTLSQSMSTLSEEYYPSISIAALLKLLKDQSLVKLHAACVQALLAVFKSIGVRSAAYLVETVPRLLGLVKIKNATATGVNILHQRNNNDPLTNSTWLSNFVLSMLSALINTVGLHIRPFSKDIIKKCTSLWMQPEAKKVMLLDVIKSLADVLFGESMPALVETVPMILSLLNNLSDHDKEVIIASLKTLESISTYASDYVHSIILTVASVIRTNDDDDDVTRACLSLILNFADRADIRLELPLIISIIKQSIEPLKSDNDILKTLRIADRLACYIAINFTEEFQSFKHQLPIDKLPSLYRMQKLIDAKGPLVWSTTATTMVDGTLYGLENDLDSLSLGHFDSLSSDRQNGTILPQSLILTTTPMSKLMMNEANLRRSWDSYDCRSKEDWFSWVRRFEAELLKESPSPALRACANLAALYYPLSRELFNAAFVACWNELPDLLQDELVGSLESALASISIPPEVMQVILNLAEFMERDDRPLPIDSATLGAYAMKCHAYAKALYHQEAEFLNAPSSESVEALISVSSQLGQPDSAVGILVCAQRNHDIRLEESWYEKLQRWDDALAAYRTRWEADPHSFDALLGIFRCWHALGDWEALGTLASEVWEDVPTSVQSSLVPLATSAAWSTGNWERMSAYADLQPEGTAEGAVFRAVLAIKRQAYNEAEHFVNLTRDILDTELTAMLSESYNRAYNTIVRAQTLSELEEVVTFCQAGHDIHKRNSISDCWRQRLNDCQVNIDVWQRILKVRSLVLPPEESLSRWIKFASLCQRNGRPILARKILLMLLHVDEGNIDRLDLTQAVPSVVYAFLKYHWETGEQEVALRFMKQYARYLSGVLDRRLSVNGGGGGGGATNTAPSLTETANVESQSKLLARCHYKLGEWQKLLCIERGEKINNSIIDSYMMATSYDKTLYKAWHGWALVNFEMAMSYGSLLQQQQQQSRRNSEPSKIGGSGALGSRTLAIGGSNSPIQQQNTLNQKNSYLVPAIQGFFRSISLSNGNSLQDSLRLLTLWFKYGSMAEVNAAIGDGFHTVPVDNWLQVITQLIARIHVPSPQVRRLVHHLLADIGRQHPQSLIYPLTVASKSQSVSRRTSALAILDKMRSHSTRLVEQALLVSQELIRVAILWEELWYEGLEEASKLYFCDRNIAGMLAILEPLHQMLESGHETGREKAFLENYGADLKEAREQCMRYKRAGNSNDLNTAWELYHQVFRKISKQLPHIGPIDLGTASPKLIAARNLEIAIPGSYRAGQPLVKIASFHPTVGVISSKQRPRKLVLLGSDGQRYKYLLKGHEDLRQDERVMQLFGLVNTILNDDPETRKRHLMIERFAVVPLSQNTGLIGWVSHCDTMHALIRDYRDARGVLLSIEHRLMLQFAPDYDNLPLLNKIEVFEHALSNIDGRDLGRIMWHRSLNSEIWLERRLAYTRSLAVMSMVGYILGLGDRHPSNLMIDQVTGRVVHIDFGDCFEVAMKREKFPEMVPFRLTRMLIRAMEVSGVEGTFRITCEHTMRVLRTNKDSLMAVLEAFVYDPLINWRLLARNEPAIVTEKSNRTATLNNNSSGYSSVSSIGGQFPENFSSSRRIRRETEISRLEDESINRPEMVNAGALNVVNRVSNKLTGKDFDNDTNALDVSTQVECLITEAAKVENLCRAYVGWCAFW